VSCRGPGTCERSCSNTAAAVAKIYILYSKVVGIFFSPPAIRAAPYCQTIYVLYDVSMHVIAALLIYTYINKRIGCSFARLLVAVYSPPDRELPLLLLKSCIKLSFPTSRRSVRSHTSPPPRGRFTNTSCSGVGVWGWTM